jgi:hypothetical protein
MNELIQKLAEESGLDARTMGVSHTEQWNASVSKLTQLIVQECLDIMSKTSKEAEERFTYMGDDVPTVVHQMNIEKHFGIEDK